MPILIVRSVDGENPLRYMKGDVVQVVPDDHVFGKMESFDVWVSEGLNPADWPGGFALVTLPDAAMGQVKQYIEEVHLVPAEMVRRRKWRFDYVNAERRTPGSGRDTLNTNSRITRNYSEILDLFTVK